MAVKPGNIEKGNMGNLEAFEQIIQMTKEGKFR